MADWIFNKRGKATIIFDNDCFRDKRGTVIGFRKGEDVYSLRGKHIGWFEEGVLFDARNKVLGFLSNATGPLPSTPGISGSPGMPGFSGMPGWPGFSGTPGRPGYSGWSELDLEEYFTLR